MRQVKRRIGTGPEARIRAYYKAHRHGEFAHDQGMNALYMDMARLWKRPIREIKKICNPARYGAFNA